MKKGKNGNGEGSIMQLGDGSWRGFVTIGFDSRGKQVKKWRRGKTRRQVAEKLNKIAAEAGSRLVSRPEEATVEEWLRRFAQLRAGEVKPRTREAHKYYIGKLVPHLGHLKLHKLNALQIKQCYAKLADQGLSPSVRQHAHQLLKAALKEAVKLGLVDRNPLDAVDAPKGGSVVEPKIWSPDEVRAFLQTANTDRLYPLFYCLLSLGPRIGEALGLRWSDIRHDRLRIERTVSLINARPVVGTPKSKRSTRTVYLSESDLALFKRRREEQALERDIAKTWQEGDYILEVDPKSRTAP